ncbi:MAG: peroxiredoxin [Cypionkella sp.]|nr:peroxiredoxin [Cypionkella sp.]
MLQIGHDFPDVALPRDGGGEIRLSDIRPKSLILFAYGADGTPSCTNEVMDFNALAADFAAKGAIVVGLSKDSPKKHDKFIAKMGITIPLASDVEEFMESIGAFGPKIFFGKPVVGVLRSTFLIDGSGKVAAIWKVDKVKGHAAEVLAAL